MTAKQALAFVKRHGIVLQSASGSVPSLAEAIVGEPIRGSWWAHPRGREIFAVSQKLCDTPDVLACKLVDGKVTYVHRKMWPALVKLASLFPNGRLDKVWDEHTANGKHVARRTKFPKWVPAEVLREAEELGEAEAERLLQKIGLG